MPRTLARTVQQNEGYIGRMCRVPANEGWIDIGREEKASLTSMADDLRNLPNTFLSMINVQANDTDDSLWRATHESRSLFGELGGQRSECLHSFYHKLGFKELAGQDEQNWLIMKNGDHVIGLFQGMFNKNILTFNPGWDQYAHPLPSFTNIRDLQKQLKAQESGFYSRG